MEKGDTDTLEDKPARTAGLLASLQRLLGSFAEILHTRVEILSTEAEEAGWIAWQLIFYVLVSLLFLGLGLLLVTLFVVIASPEIYQLQVLGGFALLYLIVGVIAVLVLRHKFNSRPRLFSTTLSELGKDRDSLSNRS